MENNDNYQAQVTELIRFYKKILEQESWKIYISFDKCSEKDEIAENNSAWQSQVSHINFSSDPDPLAEKIGWEFIAVHELLHNNFAALTAQILKLITDFVPEDRQDDIQDKVELFEEKLISDLARIIVRLKRGECATVIQAVNNIKRRRVKKDKGNSRKTKNSDDSGRNQNGPEIAGEGGK